MEYFLKYLQQFLLVLCVVVIPLVLYSVYVIFFDKSRPPSRSKDFTLVRREKSMKMIAYGRQSMKKIITADGRRHNTLYDLVPGMSRTCSTKSNDCGGQGVCVHVKSRLVLRDGTALERNRSEAEGYCLHTPGVREGDVAVASNWCNQITASPLLTVNEKGVMKQACRCHWPTLFGQTDVFSDCNVQHACDGGKGVLVHKQTGRPLMEQMPPFDIHDYECSSCDRCNTPGTDPHTGLPSCLPRPFNDRERDMCIYETNGESNVYLGESGPVAGTDHTTTDFRTTKPMLSVKSSFVDGEYMSAFTDRARATAWIPNPCAYDAITGASLYGDCELRMTRKSNTAYCAPTKDSVMTAIKDDSYLSNNRGSFPNACFRFTSNDEHVTGYVIEYFSRKRDGPDLPSPVVSMTVAKKDILNSVLVGLGLVHEPETKTILFTQPAPPSDVDEFPHPFNADRMSHFTKELNNWIEELPAKCRTSYIAPFVMYNCSAPVQPLDIPECSRIGENDRKPALKNNSPHGTWIGDQSGVYAKTTLACTKPDYDTRFPLVPNYNLKPGSIDSDPPSTILYFDKSNLTVYPHWQDYGAQAVGHLETIKRYVREELHSLPNEER